MYGYQDCWETDWIRLADLLIVITEEQATKSYFQSSNFTLSEKKIVQNKLFLAL